ncbi:N-acetylmuramoyl-L-alanine amidase [Meridianimarinicoccus sp. RP-17]|uniref:N-acetylmuramoyl-L-alanine amidase n=1 Tax=Meridianimarinicoccus zhengii TaxID=2056810 RepID=UPI001F2F55B5|nr:N-acetylmuramoyl-L-alanine amidase [Phycocomes zhengii]
MVVIHYTAMRDAESALARLCDPGAEVSAHYLIGRCGTCWQMVDDAARAWHAGAGAWGAVTDVNSRSIGIELDNDGRTPFAAPLMDRLESLLAGIMARWDIPLERVIGHACMAPDRKQDPGARFDWARLARQGLAVPTPAPQPATPGDFVAHARAVGYPDAAPDVLLAAFRTRFRPTAQGPLDATDARIMAALARDFPVDRARREV